MRYVCKEDEEITIVKSVCAALVSHFPVSVSEEKECVREGKWSAFVLQRCNSKCTWSRYFSTSFFVCSCACSLIMIMITMEKLLQASDWISVFHFSFVKFEFVISDVVQQHRYKYIVTAMSQYNILHKCRYFTTAIPVLFH